MNAMHEHDRTGSERRRSPDMMTAEKMIPGKADQEYAGGER
jgi:hypothetical protein